MLNTISYLFISNAVTRIFLSHPKSKNIMKLLQVFFFPNFFLMIGFFQEK